MRMPADSTRSKFTACTLIILLAAEICASPYSAEGGITAVYQHASDNDVNNETSASADLFFTRQQHSGNWFLYLEASTTPGKAAVSSLYPTANADAGSVISNGSGGGVQISEFNYTLRFTHNNSMKLGLVDPSAWLDRSRIANDENLHFLNGSFVNNATIEFPDYTLGAIYHRSSSNRFPEIVAIVTNAKGLADLPDRSYQHLLEFDGRNDGLFLAAGASWNGQNSNARLGLWIRTDDHTRAGTGAGTESNYGAYIVLGWRRDWGAMNVRMGIANEHVSVATGFAAISYERSTRLGLFGAGLARTWLSDDFRETDLEDTIDAEMFLRVRLSASIQITPTIQYVENPGFDVLGTTADSATWVSGLRLHWSF